MMTAQSYWFRFSLHISWTRQLDLTLMAGDFLAGDVEDSGMPESLASPGVVGVTGTLLPVT